MSRHGILAMQLHADLRGNRSNCSAVCAAVVRGGRDQNSRTHQSTSTVPEEKARNSRLEEGGTTLIMVGQRSLLFTRYGGGAGEAAVGSLPVGVGRQRRNTRLFCFGRRANGNSVLMGHSSRQKICLADAEQTHVDFLTTPTIINIIVSHQEWTMMAASLRRHGPLQTSTILHKF